jgi:dihydrofolate reductase
MWNLVTLDGFFEGPKSWEIDWHNVVWGEELVKFSLDQLKSIGALLFGRITYEGMASHWTTATGEIAGFMNSIPKIVFSRTLKKADWNNTTLVKENAVEELIKLKQLSALPAGGSGKDLYIFGSANLSSTFMHQGTKPMKRTFALILAAAHVSVQPAAASVYTMSAGRIGATTAAV